MKKILLLLLFSQCALPMTEISSAGNQIVECLNENPKIAAALFCGTVYGITSYIKMKQPDFYNKNKAGIYAVETINEFVQGPQDAVLRNVPAYTTKLFHSIADKPNKPSPDLDPLKYLEESLKNSFEECKNKEEISAAAGYATMRATEALFSFPKTTIKYIWHNAKKPIANQFATQNKDSFINNTGNLAFYISMGIAICLFQTEWLEFLASNSKYAKDFLNIFSNESIFKKAKRKYWNKEDVTTKSFIFSNEE